MDVTASPVLTQVPHGAKIKWVESFGDGAKHRQHFLSVADSVCTTRSPNDDTTTHSFQVFVKVVTNPVSLSPFILPEKILATQDNERSPLHQILFPSARHTQRLNRRNRGRSVFDRLLGSWGSFEDRSPRTETSNRGLWWRPPASCARRVMVDPQDHSRSRQRRSRFPTMMLTSLLIL